MATFSAQVKDWAKKTDLAQERIFKMSVQKLVDVMLLPINQGGSMPVVTGNLRRSLLASTSAMPSARVGVIDFADGYGQVALTINSARVSDTIYLGFQAAYAARVNYGFVGTDSLGRNYNQTGHGFVELAVQRWQDIVNEAVAEYES